MRKTLTEPNTKTWWGALVAASALLLAGCGGSDDNAQASSDVNLEMATFYDPDTGAGRAMEKWINEVEKRSNGEISITSFWNGELLGADEIKDGLTEGRIQIGHFASAYTPSDFPLSSMTEVHFLGSNIGAQVTAMNRLYDQNEEFRAEWEDRNGIKVLSFNGVSPSVVGTKEPVESIDWFKGKPIRAAAAITDAMSAVGANPTPIIIEETYEAMQRGTVDAYSALALDILPSTGLLEVGPHITEVPTGHYSKTTWAMSMDAWNSLSPEHQSILEEVNAEYPTWVVESTSEVEDAGCEAIMEAGGTISKLPESEIDEWEEAIGNDSLNNWLDRASQTDISDPAAMYEEMVTYYEEAEEGEYSDLPSAVDRCLEQF